MEIKQLEREVYAGKQFTARYQTKGYYDIVPWEYGFRMEYRHFDETTERSFVDEMFGEWLEEPVAFGAVENGTLIGFVEGSMENWNNRFRISNICVFDHERRSGEVGTALMEKIEAVAKVDGARMVVLETQSCNENAIGFYRKCGFEMIGFDLYAYSNNDPQRHEVRVEMGKRL